MSKQMLTLYRSVQSAKRRMRVIEIAYSALVNTGCEDLSVASEGGFIEAAIQRFERDVGLRLTPQEVTDCLTQWRAHVDEAIKEMRT